ncbi:MAG: sugar transferase [Lachnospiraceae bacterium]|nr:sugar transferase [Lachnospiraceae bacterium]
MRKNGVEKYIHFIVTVAIFCIFWWLHLNYIDVKVDTRYSIFVCVIYAVLFYSFAKTYNCYQLGYDSSGELIYSQAIAGLICISGSYLGISLIWNKFYPVRMFALAFVVQMLWNIVWSIVATKIYFVKNPRRAAAVIYQDTEDLVRIREIYDSKLFRITKEIRIDEGVESSILLNEILEYKVLFVTGISATLRNGIAKYCKEEGVEGYFIPHVGDVIMAGAPHAQSFSVPLQLVERANPDIGYLFVKRSFDMLFALLGIVITSPIMAIIAAAIKINDGGSVIYKQVRLTKGGKHFNMFKFRSMKENAEEDGVARLASEHDDRITKVGKVIRACRFDELPQLFNILSGDMSFVGPRPERPELAAELMKEIPAFDLRLQVKAGLTGYAQVYGKYNTDSLDKLKLDLMYINRMNWFEDLKLMFATVKILFIKESTEGVREQEG